MKKTQKPEKGIPPASPLLHGEKSFSCVMAEDNSKITAKLLLTSPLSHVRSLSTLGSAWNSSTATLLGTSTQTRMGTGGFGVYTHTQDSGITAPEVLCNLPPKSPSLLAAVPSVSSFHLPPWAASLEPHPAPGVPPFDGSSSWALPQPLFAFSHVLILRNP